MNWIQRGNKRLEDSGLQEWTESESENPDEQVCVWIMSLILDMRNLRSFGDMTDDNVKWTWFFSLRLRGEQAGSWPTNQWLTAKRHWNHVRRDFRGGPAVRTLSAGDTDSMPGPGRPHIQRGNEAQAPQLPSLYSRALGPQLLKPMCPTSSARQQAAVMGSPHTATRQ